MYGTRQAARQCHQRISGWMEVHDSKEFEYTGGDFMTSFLGLEVEQAKGQIQLHLDTYVNEMLEDYKAYTKRDLKPKKIPMQPGVVLI
jgi:hypothetical protein